MKFKVTRAALGLALSGALLLGACTSEEPTTENPPATDNTPTAGGETSTSEQPSGDATASESEGTAPAGDNPAGCLQDVGITETKDGQVSYTAGPGDWNGYNSITSKTYSTYNSAIAYHMFSSFIYFGTDGTICRNPDFGTVEVTSEDPLTVKYTISDKAVWSDGTPVTINDYLLDWAAQNPEWLVPGYANEKDENAEPIFDHVSTTFAKDSTKGPQGEPGAKEFTVVFDNKNPDYLLTVGSTLPAHVAAKKSGLEPDALAKAILDQDAETVKKVAKFWNTGWIYNPGELPDMADVPSSGPYILKEGGWKAGNSLILTANDKYWGTPPATKDLVFRFFDDAAQVQALQNGDVQAIAPQATVDTLGQLQAIGDAVKIESFSVLTWEHLDFNFRPASVFSDEKGGIKLREAFAYCVPRQGIVDSLIKPIDEGAVVMNAREVFPFQENYEDVVKASYDGRYDEVNIEESKKLIAESGVATPIEVRIGYRAGNSRRTDTVAAIAASCKDAGFNVTDVNSTDFFDKALPDGDYEVALFAWAGSGQKASGQNIYATAKPQNYGEYSNKEVDAAWNTLAGSLDESVQQEQVKVIEKLLWDTLYGIPLYAHPGIAAWDANMSNVRPPAGQDGVIWNANQWQLNS